MCLAIPGQIVEAKEKDGLRYGTVRFGGVTRQACLDFVPEAQCGDYVIVHAGFAITRLDVEEAEKTLALFDEIAAHLEMPTDALHPRLP